VLLGSLCVVWLYIALDVLIHSARMMEEASSFLSFFYFLYIIYSQKKEVMIITFSLLYI
jgi:hypothetical protein